MPDTGALVPKGTPGSIGWKTYKSGCFGDPKTKRRNSREQGGVISSATLRSQKLVDSVTGAAATDKTEHAVPYHVFRGRSFVDPITGTRVLENTPDAVRYYVFQRRGYVDPTTGKRAFARTPGAVPAAAYEKLLSQK
ncbi:MAG: hypothetical protein EOO38_10350 [Cytophagaceae bacterium]|nr:MAG: hypothetical protein EOO38_10350 [Cytophagaceae bacterium]